MNWAKCASFVMVSLCVAAMARAGIAAGADALMVEVHPDPDAAISDRDQTITLEAFVGLMDQVRRVAEAVGRTL